MQCSFDSGAYRISSLVNAAGGLFHFGTFRCGVYFKNQNRRKSNHLSVQNSNIILKPCGVKLLNKDENMAF